jgi:hypothetical protein
MPAPSRRAEWLLLAFSSLATLLVLEAALRLAGAGAEGPSGYAPVETNRRQMRPQNSQMFRDLERGIPKPAGVRRVLVLGDSFAWGVGVEFEDALPQRLERALTRRRREPWEVVSLALPGMNTVEQAQQLLDRGFAYEPDVVLLAFVLNDSEDTDAAEARRAVDWSRRKREPSVLDRSLLLNIVRTRLWATAENRRRISGYRSMYRDDAPGWTSARAALRRMGEACRERHVPFVVAVFPLFGNPLGADYPFADVHARIRAAAVDAGAQVVDLLPAYDGLRSENLVVDGAADEHPNEIAHRIAAGVLLKELDRLLGPVSETP